MKTNVLLQGEIGTGKTRSLMTLLPHYIDEDGRVQDGAGLDVFLVSMEAGAEATLGRNFCGSPTAIDNPIHQVYVPANAADWDTVRAYVKLANELPLDQLLKTQDPNRRQYRQFMQVFSVLSDYTCIHCGENFGDVGTWNRPPDAEPPNDETSPPAAVWIDPLPRPRAICLDSLTGLTKAATQNLVGGKPIRSLPEIGTIMDFIEAFFDLFWGNTACSAICLAHVDREISPLTGISTITVHTIGQKLAPRLVKKPDEVITSHYSDGRYFWSTEGGPNEVMKRRRLPVSDNLPADFSQIFLAAGER